MDPEPRPLEPVLVADRFAPLGRALAGLLEGLAPAAWDAPTVCAGWRVRDIAAHLLDGAFRRLSFERDRLAPPAPDAVPEDGDGLTAFLDALNASWIDASRRLSPRLLVELTAFVEPPLAAHLASLDPFGEALFPVAWAGEHASACWFDVARELTERWHHQQQIRMAVGADLLDDPFFLDPVLETLVRVLPHHYRSVDAGAGATLTLRVPDRGLSWTLARDGGTWILLRGAAATPDASVTLPAAPAWRLLTRGIDAAAARREATVEGDTALASPLFAAVAVMARSRAGAD